MRKEEIHTRTFSEDWAGAIVTDRLVAERHMVERYLRDQMGADEQAAFEEHYLDCPSCLDELDAGRRLRDAWGRLAREETRARLLEGAAHPAGGKVLAFPARTAALWRAVALAALVLLALSGGRLLQQNALAERLRAAETKLGELARSAGAAGPIAQTRLVLLGSLRGETPATNIRLSPDDLQMVLMVPVEAEAGDPHDVQLRRGSEILWEARGVRANRRRELLITVPSSYLAPGSYELRVEGPNEKAAHPFAIDVAETSAPPAAGR